MLLTMGIFRNFEGWRE